MGLSAEVPLLLGNAGGILDVGRVEKIKEKIFRSKEFEVLAERSVALKAGESLVLSGLAGSMPAFVALRLFEERQSQVLLIASDEERAEKLRDDCALLASEAN